MNFLSKPFAALLGLGLLASSLLFSCKNDFDVNGDWKEIMVVYGLLSPADSVQYVKINKAFMGKGNAYDMAMIADSSSYKPGDIQAVIEKVKDGVIKETYLLTYDTDRIKAPGTFANSPNGLYKTNAKIVQDGSSYRLTVTNQKTGVVATSETPIVGALDVLSPNSNTSIKFDWVNNYAKPRAPNKVRWNKAENGKMYQLIIRFHYTEVSKVDTSIKTPLTLDWVFASQTAVINTIEQEIYGEDFYKFLSASLDENSDVLRIANGLEFIFNIGAEELYNYIEANKASTGIVQEKPIYTNIKGGTGIFSSRMVHHTPILKMNAGSLLALDTCQHTYNLGFCDADNNASPYYCY